MSFPKKWRLAKANYEWTGRNAGLANLYGRYERVAIEKRSYRDTKAPVGFERIEKRHQIFPELHVKFYQPPFEEFLKETRKALKVVEIYYVKSTA